MAAPGHGRGPDNNHGGAAPSTTRPFRPVRSASNRTATLPACAPTPVPSPVTDMPANHEVRFIYRVPSSARILGPPQSKNPLQDRHFGASTAQVARPTVTRVEVRSARVGACWLLTPMCGTCREDTSPTARTLELRWSGSCARSWAWSVNPSPTCEEKTSAWTSGWSTTESEHPSTLHPTRRRAGVGDCARAAGAAPRGYSLASSAAAALGRSVITADTVSRSSIHVRRPGSRGRQMGGGARVRRVFVLRDTAPSGHWLRSAGCVAVHLGLAPRPTAGDTRSACWRRLRIVEPQGPSHTSHPAACLHPVTTLGEEELRDAQRAEAEAVSEVVTTGSLVTWLDWLGMDLSERRALLGRHLAAVMVSAKLRRGPWSDPGRLSSHWMDGDVQTATDADLLRARWSTARQAVDGRGLQVTLRALKSIFTDAGPLSQPQGVTHES